MDFRGSSRLNYSNISNSSYCLDLSAKEMSILHNTFIGVSSTAGVVCILAITVILATKGYKKFVHRLILYLMAVVLPEEVVSILAVAPVHLNGSVVAVREGFEGLCAAAGFLYQVVFWMELLVICWIALYLLGMIALRRNVTAVKWKQEVCGLAVVLLLPFLFNWIPFAKDMYGLSGLFCWIKQSMNSNCKYDYVGLTLMFVLHPGPEVTVGTIVLVSLVAIAIVMCRRTMRHWQGTHRQSIHRQGLKEVLPLLVYPLIYLVLWAAAIAFRIVDVVSSVQDRRPIYSLSLVHSIISSVRTLTVPLICLLHLSIVYCRKQQNREHTLSTTTSYTVSNEFTDQEDDPLIIRGSGLLLHIVMCM